MCVYSVCACLFVRTRGVCVFVCECVCVCVDSLGKHNLISREIVSFFSIEDWYTVVSTAQFLDIGLQHLPPPLLRWLFEDIRDDDVPTLVDHVTQHLRLCLGLRLRVRVRVGV